MARAPAAARVEAVRRFSRFYTRRIGVLREHLLDSPLSLTEARIVFELAQRPGVTASDLARDLDLDTGYLSRLLAAFHTRGIVERQASARDGRRQQLRLTRKGQRLFATLDERSRTEVAALLATLGRGDQRRVIDAMETVRALLGDEASPGGATAVAASRAPAPARTPPCVIRSHRPGDLGWVVSTHGAVYAEEHGWDATFEALVAEIAAKFLREFDPAHECCLIAEIEGRTVGSVCIVRETCMVAKLRLLIVEPEARGHGIGARLVDEAIRFARAKGYTTMTLWTSDNLPAARHLYERAGFVLRESHPERRFGKDLVFQTWDLSL